VRSARGTGRVGFRAGIRGGGRGGGAVGVDVPGRSVVPATEQHPADPGAGGEGEGERDPLGGVRWRGGGQQRDRRVYRGRIPRGGQHAIAAGLWPADRRAGRDAGWWVAAVQGRLFQDRQGVGEGVHHGQAAGVGQGRRGLAQQAVQIGGGGDDPGVAV